MASCGGQPAGPLNRQIGTISSDAILNIITHEVEEAATDPELNAWYFASGAENADKRAWTFGTTCTLSNGNKWNMLFDAAPYAGLKAYVQQARFLGSAWPSQSSRWVAESLH